MGKVVRPDSWLLLEFSTKDGPKVMRVLTGSYGGYGGADSWRLSSGVVENGIAEFDDRYEFTNASGSVYMCYKAEHGATGYMTQILSYWVKTYGDELSIREVELPTNA